MAIDLDDVRKLGRLARIPLGPGPDEAWIEPLSAIIAYFDQLADYPADDEPEPTADGGPAWAADTPEDSMARPLFTANAPAARDGFLVVPKVKADG